MNLGKNTKTIALLISVLLNIFLILVCIYKPKINSELSVFSNQSIDLNVPENQTQNLKLRHDFLKVNTFLTRDYIYYQCKDRRRIGGMVKPSNKLDRVDGAWFICFDNNLAPKSNDCKVLSFGINADESFDDDINKDYGCNVYSFDPFFEADRFKTIRNSQKLNSSFIIKVNNKWNFYRIGVTGEKKNVIRKKRIGWIETLENIIKFIDLENQIIDIFKMDIEWNEINVMEHLDVDYACNYFKQFVFETHSHGTINNLYYLVKKLEKCFSLFHRDARLIAPQYIPHYETFHDAAKQNKKINLGDYKNEINLSNFLLSTGELYFINENFR